uniref:Peptidase M16 C-terminal domain-containing protein n=1 Tax=Acrobeloides nanus TaxID=290746 RepID=A0A914D5H3_9BILA
MKNSISKPGVTVDWSAVGSTKLASVASTESAFIIQKAPFDQGYGGPDIVEVLLLSQYLSQCEGPLWNSVRGRGLAYGANIYPLADQGSLVLSLYRCSQPVEAYKATKDLILGILDSKEVSPTLFEAAKRSLVCELAASYENVKSACQVSLLSTLRDIPHDYIVKLCQRIWEASEDRVLEKGSPYLRNLFDDNKCVRSITAHPSKVSEIELAFKNATTIKIENLQVEPPEFKNVTFENDTNEV